MCPAPTKSLKESDEVDESPPEIETANKFELGALRNGAEVGFWVLLMMSS